MFLVTLLFAVFLFFFPFSFLQNFDEDESVAKRNKQSVKSICNDCAINNIG